MAGPNNRPQICFDTWGEIPPDEAGALPLPLGSPIPGRFLQKGFHLVNDGGAAHEIKVESFEVEPSVRAGSKAIRHIAEKEKGFAHVWLEGYPPWMFAVGKWNLLEAMATAYNNRHGDAFFGPDHSVKVSVVYRDADGLWYRSSADLTYIRSQRRLEFGPTTQQECGPTCPILDADSAREAAGRVSSPTHAVPPGGTNVEAEKTEGTTDGPMSAENEPSGIDRPAPETIDVVGGGIVSGFDAGVPGLRKQIHFSCQSLPDGPEALKQEVANLAHTAITALTRDSTVPQAAPEDWLGALRLNGYMFETMEELLVASEAHLHALALDELSVGELEQSERLTAIERRFNELHQRFLPPDALAMGTNQPPPTSQQAPKETSEAVEMLDAISNFDSLNRVSEDDPSYPIWKEFYVKLHKTDAQFVSHHARQVLERKPLDPAEFFARAVDLFKTAAEAQISLVTNLESVGNCERELKTTVAGALKLFEQFLQEFGQDAAASGKLLADLRLTLLESAAQAKLRALERAEMIEKQQLASMATSDQAQGKAIVDLLGRIVEKRNITIEGWAQSHGFKRTTVFDWKALRFAGKPLTGKVSNDKGTEIEKAIEEDAAELGLTTRTDSD